MGGVPKLLNAFGGEMATPGCGTWGVGEHGSKNDPYKLLKEGNLTHLVDYVHFNVGAFEVLEEVDVVIVSVPRDDDRSEESERKEGKRKSKRKTKNNFLLSFERLSRALSSCHHQPHPHPCPHPNNISHISAYRRVKRTFNALIW